MLWSLLVGLVIGALAKFIMPGKDPGGIIITMLLGVAGAALANWVGTQMGAYGPNEVAGVFASVLGAVVLLAIYRAFAGRRRITS